MTVKKYKWVPVINTTMCNGCRECVLACGPKCLEIKGQVAVLTKPDICGSEEHCIAPCPIGVIRMEWVEMEGDLNLQRGKWRIEKSCGPGA
jgi:Na+-translocating ferredoxin:NAD+ oxidoreductase RNF subunit RnfB